MRLIPLTKGKYAIVDDEDYELLNRDKWHAINPHGNNNWYAARTSKIHEGRRHAILMHTQLTGYIQTDHKNGNGLDNRRENLREITDLQNQRNKRKQSGKTSSVYKGVYWNKAKSKWQAQIKLGNGKCKNIGLFANEAIAANAYDSFARFCFGAHAALNFPKEGEMSALVRGVDYRD